MTEEHDYTKLEEGVEFYLHNGKGEYWVPDGDFSYKKECTRPTIFYVLACGYSNCAVLVFDGHECDSTKEYFVAANNQLCCRSYYDDDDDDDEILHCVVDMTISRLILWAYPIDEFNNLTQIEKDNYELVIVEFGAPFILK